MGTGNTSLVWTFVDSVSDYNTCCLIFCLKTIPFGAGKNVPNKKDPIVLPNNSPILKLFQQIRDEAHRFAVRLHKKQREKRITGSILADIKGVGPATRNMLLKHFGSVNNIKTAKFEELTPIIGKKLAEIILKELNR